MKKKKGKTGLAVIYTAIFIFLIALASNVSEVTSMLFFDFSKSLAEVGSPSIKFAEISLVLAGIGFLVLAAEVVISE